MPGCIAASVANSRNQRKQRERTNWKPGVFTLLCLLVCVITIIYDLDSFCQSSHNVIMYAYSLQTLSTKQSDPDDFLEFLLHGSDSSSVPASPLWSPCTSDSGITEDPLTDPTNSPHTASCTASTPCDIQAFTQSSCLVNQTVANEKKPDVVIDLGKTTFK